MGSVNRSVAIQDITRWLDEKKVRESKRTEFKQHIDGLISAVEDGLIVVNEDGTITQSLLWPIGEKAVDKLTYKMRLNYEMVKPYLKNIQADNGNERLIAYACALTEESSGILNKLDSEDSVIMQSIAVFFL